MRCAGLLILMSYGLAQDHLPTQAAPVPAHSAPKKPIVPGLTAPCKTLAAANKFTQADKCYSDAIQVSQGKPAYIAAYLEFLIGQDARERVRALIPSYEKRWPRVADISAAHGWLSVQLGDLDAAKAAYQQAGRLDSVRASEFQHRLAGDLLAAGKFDDAITVLNDRLRAYPATADQHEELARLLEQRKRWAEAEAEYRAADARDPQHSHLSSFAFRLELAGQIDDAIRVYKSLAQAAGPFANSFSPEAMALRRVLESHERWDELARYCGESRDSSCPFLITTLTTQGKVDGALKIYRAIRSAEDPYRVNSLSGIDLYRSNLIEALKAAGRLDDAVGLCTSKDSYACEGILAQVFKSGQIQRGVELARKMVAGEILKGQALQLLSYGMDLGLDGQVALTVEAAKEDHNTLMLAMLLQQLEKQGRLAEAGESLRRTAAGFEIDTKSSVMSEATLYQLAFLGYLTAKAPYGVQLVDRTCHQNGPFVSGYERLPVAFPTLATCQCFGCNFLLVEYQGRTWGGEVSKLTFEVAPVTAVLRSNTNVSFQQAVATAPMNGANPQEQQVQIVDEVTLGLNARDAILASHPLLDDPTATKAGSEAFRGLMNTSVARDGDVKQYQLSLLSDDSLNAFSTAGGQIYVNKGMLSIIGDSPGMWAAVLGHETGHIVAHHQYKHYVRQMSLRITQDALRQQAATGNKVAQWGWLFSMSGGRLLNLKLSRNEELEADRLGMLMMAEAGYHPGFILALGSRLQSAAHQNGKLVTFLSSDHPRWETREKKNRATYQKALEIFQSKWPNAAASPGGLPPKS